jgi:hypothetical protein
MVDLCKCPRIFTDIFLQWVKWHRVKPVRGTYIKLVFKNRYRVAFHLVLAVGHNMFNSSIVNNKIDAVLQAQP